MVAEPQPVTSAGLSPVLHASDQHDPCRKPGASPSSGSPGQTVDSVIRIMGWNVGGADLAELPKAVRGALGDKGKKQDLVLLQEVPRDSEGWSYTFLEGQRVVSHRRASQWRGTGLWYDTSTWCLLPKLHSSKGVWFKLRHLEQSTELWLGTSHFTPGCTASQFEEEAEDHSGQLPASAQRVIYHGDVNTGFTWACEGDSVVPVAKEGKGGIMHRVLTERPDQWTTPTSRPRQEGRHGQCIDIMCFRGIRCTSFRIHENSYMMLGTDHEMCHSEFVVQEKRQRPRHDTKPRVWVGGITKVDSMDQSCVEDLARWCTKPAPGHGYRDTAEIKKAFREGKRSGVAAQWKQALKLRKEARKKWEQERLLRASQGDWGSFKALRPQRQEGWDVVFAEAQPGDPHEAGSPCTPFPGL